MRQLVSMLLVLLLSGLAAGQSVATVVSGYASNWAVPPGAFWVPFVPLVSTPSVELPTPSLTVGASSATIGLSGQTSDLYPAPRWYGVRTASAEAESNELSPTSDGGPEHGLKLGIATFRDDGIASLVKETRLGPKAARSYTNQDIEELNQKNGIVKYAGKTERLS